MSCTAAGGARKLDWAFIDVLTVDIKFRPAAYGGGGEWIEAGHLPSGMGSWRRCAQDYYDVYG